eukprot:5396768-Amphidinium_carterae.1
MYSVLVILSFHNYNECPRMTAPIASCEDCNAICGVDFGSGLRNVVAVLDCHDSQSKQLALLILIGQLSTATGEPGSAAGCCAGEAPEKLALRSALLGKAD